MRVFDRFSAAQAIALAAAVGLGVVGTAGCGHDDNTPPTTVVTPAPRNTTVVVPGGPVLLDLPALPVRRALPAPLAHRGHRALPERRERWQVLTQRLIPARLPRQARSLCSRLPAMEAGSFTFLLI